MALAEVEGPEVALPRVGKLDLIAYHPWHVARADLLRRLGRLDEARKAYDAALELVGTSAERAYLTLQPAHMVEKVR